MSHTEITPQVLYNKFKEEYPQYDCNFNRFQTGCAVARYYQTSNELGRFPEFDRVDEWVYNYTAVYSIGAINEKHTLEYSEWRSTDEGKIAVINFYKRYQHLAENGPFDFHVKGFDVGQIMWTDVIGWKGLAIIEEAGSNIVMAVYETLRMVREYEEHEESEAEADTPEGKGSVKNLKENTEGNEDDGNDENNEKDRKRGRRSAANPFDDGPAQPTSKN